MSCVELNQISCCHNLDATEKIGEVIALHFFIVLCIYVLCIVLCCVLYGSCSIAVFYCPCVVVVRFLCW